MRARLARAATAAVFVFASATCLVVPGSAAHHVGRDSSAGQCGAHQFPRAGRCTGFGQAERRILGITSQLKEANSLRAVILRVDVGRQTLAEAAMGNSMAGRPATRRMRFRTGSVAVSYLTTILLQLQDAGKLDLDQKLSEWFPQVPRAHRITLRMLASSTSGYFDYAQGNAKFLRLFAANVFRQWKPAELLRLAFERGFACAPGTCFNYSHANFIILGKVLHKVTGKPVRSLMRKRILEPLGLQDTSISSYPDIPPPVLHAYSRRADGGPYEDSTFWSPSWGLGPGMLQTSTVDDVAHSALAIGAGRLISRRAHREQIAPPHFDAGGSPPSLYYGLGLVVANSWLVQNPMFNGHVGLMGYLPGKRISIAIESTYGPATADSTHFSTAIFDRIGSYLAPRKAPGMPP